MKIEKKKEKRIEKGKKAERINGEKSKGRSEFFLFLFFITLSCYSLCFLYRWFLLLLLFFSLYFFCFPLFFPLPVSSVFFFFLLLLFLLLFSVFLLLFSLSFIPLTTLTSVQLSPPHLQIKREY